MFQINFQSFRIIYSHFQYIFSRFLVISVRFPFISGLLSIVLPFVISGHFQLFTDSAEEPHYKGEFIVFLIEFFRLFSRKFPFSNKQVRILLFRECDLRGKKLLFDSIGIQNVAQHNPGNAQKNRTSCSSTSSSINHIELSDGYLYVRPDGDHNSISEMIFGSVAMAFRGASLKVYIRLFILIFSVRIF